MPVNITTLIHALAAPLLRASRNTRRLVALLLDVVVVGTAFYGVMALRYSGLPMPFIDSVGIVTTALVVAIGAFLALGLYRSLIRGMSAAGFAVILVGCAL